MKYDSENEFDYILQNIQLKIHTYFPNLNTPET